MAFIYLSPSTQQANAYVGGSNEETQMRKVVDFAAGVLRSAGHSVRVGGTVSAAANVRDANAHRIDWYVAVHSDAGGGDGTTVFHAGTAKGKRLAEALYAAVAPISPGTDNGVRVRTDLIETNGPKAPAALIEVAFHDNRTEAAHIRANTEAYGRAIAKGVMAVAGGSVPPKPKPVPCSQSILVVPAVNKSEFVAAMRALGQHTSQMAGDEGQAVFRVHHRTDLADEVEAAAKRALGYRIALIGARYGDTTVREVVPASGKFIGRAS